MSLWSHFAPISFFRGHPADDLNKLVVDVLSLVVALTCSASYHVPALSSPESLKLLLSLGTLFNPSGDTSAVFEFSPDSARD